MVDYSIAGSSGTTGLSHWTSPAIAGKFAAVDPSDSTTPPAGSAGADKWLTIGQALNLGCTIFPSGITSGTTDAAAVTAALSYAKTVTLAPVAPWYIAGGSVTLTTGQYINAQGCLINAVGTGAVFRFVDSSTYSGRTTQGGGLFGMPIIDGTATTGNAYAVHAGDILQLGMFAQAQNFTAGTTSKGFWFDNQNYWTEQMYGRVLAQNCTAHVVFDCASGAASTAGGSFDRTDLDVYIIQENSAFDGVVFQNGTYIIDGALSIRGNWVGAVSAPSSALLRLTGVAGAGRPDTGVYSNLASCRLDIGAECDTSNTGPFTIVFGAAGNFIYGCYGTMDFEAAGVHFQSSNSAGLSQFSYAGAIAGDSVLASNYVGGLTTTKIQVYGGAANPSVITADTNGLLQVTDPAGMTSWVQQTQSASVSANSVTNTTTIGFLGWLTAPANEPVAGTKYRYSMHGTLGTTTGTNVGTLDIRWGAGTTGTLLMSIVTGTSAPALTASLTAVPVQIEGEVEFTTTTAAIGWMKMTWRNSATASTAATVALVQVSTAVTSLPVSGTEFLQVNWTWGTANAANTITIAASSFERVA